MAGTTAMSGYTRKICVSDTQNARVTMIANGAEVYPGHCVTCQGETWPDVALPDAISDSVFGIAGVPPGADIDTVIGDNVEFTVYRCGSGAIVYGFHKGAAKGGSVVAGEIVCAYGAAANGAVIAANKIMAAAIAGATASVIATAVTKFYAMVGRAMETHASNTATQPIQIMLSV